MARPRTTPVSHKRENRFVHCVCTCVAYTHTHSHPCMLLLHIYSDRSTTVHIAVRARAFDRLMRAFRVLPSYALQLQYLCWCTECASGYYCGCMYAHKHAYALLSMISISVFYDSAVGTRRDEIARGSRMHHSADNIDARMHEHSSNHFIARAESVRLGDSSRVCLCC